MLVDQRPGRTGQRDGGLAALPPTHQTLRQPGPDYGVADAAHYAVPEDFRRLQPPLHLLIPSMRGDLVSRPVDDVLREAEAGARRS